MILLGVIVNTVAIIIGACLGQFFTRINSQMKETIMKAIAIAVVVLGLDMAFTSNYFLIILSSLVIGGMVGEVLHIELKLEKLGKWLEQKVGKNKGDVAKAFVTTTLIYCIGAMSVVGALNSGLRLDHNVLYTKSFLDGFTGLIFSSTLGIGVIFSAIPVFLYQGAIALAATQINHWLSAELINRIVDDITSTGGILIIAIGLNILEITKIKVGNLLPSLLVAILLSLSFFYVQPMFL